MDGEIERFVVEEAEEFFVIGAIFVVAGAEAGLHVGELGAGVGEGDIEEAFVALACFGDEAVIDVADGDFVAGEDLERVVLVEVGKVGGDR